MSQVEDVSPSDEEKQEPSISCLNRLKNQLKLLAMIVLFSFYEFPNTSIEMRRRGKLWNWIHIAVLTADHLSILWSVFMRRVYIDGQEWNKRMLDWNSLACKINRWKVKSNPTVRRWNSKRSFKIVQVCSLFVYSYLS